MTQLENNDRAQPADHAADTASEALAGALKLSFRLLTVIMVLVVVAFLLTGVRQVKSDQVGIHSVLGRVIGTAEPGLTYTWPFPIGRMDIIDLSKRELAIDDFWVFETPEEITKGALNVRAGEPGLMPDRDGALLTGDGNLLHVKLLCIYGVATGRIPGEKVDPAVLFQTNVDDQNTEQARKLGQPLRSEEIIRSVICRAAIRAAATRTAEGIRTDTGSFTLVVRQLAQDQLDEMRTGLQVRAVNAVRVSWPRRVLSVVDEASAARQAIAESRSKAESEATATLSGMAGAGYVELVGELDGTGEPGLITLYTRAREQGRSQDAKDLLARINAALDATTGQAQTIIQEARRDRDILVEPIKGRLALFQQLLPQYRLAPEFTVAQLWADTRDAILNNPMAEKFYVNKGDGTVVVKINRDPAIAQRIQQYLLTSEAKDEEE